MRDLLSTIVALYPAELPLVCLAGSGRYVILALRFSEVPFPAAADARLGIPAGGPAAVPFRRGLIGLLSFDALAGEPAADAAPSRVFQVEQALVIDRDSGAVTLTGEGVAGAASYAVPAPVIARLRAALAAEAPAPAAPVAAVPELGVGLLLTPQTDDASYLQLVARALDDIRAGRYYQINLLRYFRVAPAPNRAWLAHRIDRDGGAFSALFDLPDLTVASFSPERFVRIVAADGAPVAEAYPIKGTAAREPDRQADAAAARALAASPKDLAELHMIVDLMRNDLHRVAVPGSVRVPETDRLVSVRTVHHLQAKVTARLRPELRLGDLLGALCPGGSVTGAPKREVLGAIRAYEGRTRGYFMGHAFYLDEGGAFDSSLLIRTLVRARENAYAFAAGSGIVIASDPGSERREIEAKCRVVTAASEV